MLFNSLHFCIFFPIVSFLYYIVPERYAWLVLLGASYYFYMSWNATFILLIVLSTIIDYFASLHIAASKNLFTKRFYLAASMFSNLGLLFTFKYFNFFIDSANIVLSYTGSNHSFTALNVILPVGISFYTFQTMSYTIDVYRGDLEPERNFGKFALFVTFFPQLVAGPIERAGSLLKQFQQRIPFSYDNAVIGLRTFLGGMLLKVVVADNVSCYVDAVYNNVQHYTGWPLLFATYLFAFQIFCDFAGYTYMAIGIAKVLGFSLMENFRQPYLATSIPDFWRRWHISLSSWFRDYLYIPLGGSKVSINRWVVNILITFLVSGLWHGANWTFVVWGGLNGLYCVIDRFMPADAINRLPKFARMLITFCLVCFTWIFFRANSLADAWYVINHLFDGVFDWQNLLSLRRAVVMGRTMPLEYLFLLTSGVWLAQLVQEYYGHIRERLYVLPSVMRMGVYYAAFALIFFLGEFGGQQFIYFQF